jgi:hypothetical protein
VVDQSASLPKCIMRSALLVFFAGTAAASGSQTAFDSAGDSAYNSGWTSVTNGGFGWGGGWTFTLNPSFAFIGSSATNGFFGDPNSDGDINSPRSAGGRAWGLWGRSAAIRTFDGNLSVGQTFSVDFDDMGARNVPNSFEYLYLLKLDGTAGVFVSAIEGPDYFVGYNNSGVNQVLDAGVADTSEGIRLDFTRTVDGVSLGMTPYLTGATTTLLSLPYTGDLSAVELYSNAGAFGIDAVYVNNIAITPEPGTAGIVAASLGGMFMIRRRR